MSLKISIITVCFNSASTIRDTVNSVVAQDYKDIEYIIVDGGSTDLTMDIVREYKDKIDVIISEPDKGIYDAMNKGISASSGDLVCILNSDDFYINSSCISRLVNKINKEETDCVYADLLIVDSEDTNRIKRYYDSGRFNKSLLRYGWMPAHPTFVARKEIYIKYGLYSLAYDIAADFEMFVRLFCCANVSYAYLPEPVIKMRAGGVSTSGVKNSWKLNNEIVRACRSNGINTNILIVLLKIPMKLLEYVFKSK